ncbi:MAG TPA: hypothetical protein VMA37_01285 [Acetobacteraceae bacterium]|nr:hypothetical protein [Acetobacteraceae bacterium]
MPRSEDFSRLANCGDSDRIDFVRVLLIVGAVERLFAAKKMLPLSLFLIFTAIPQEWDSFCQP